MMTPWHDPVYLRRVWCVFELYTALAAGSHGAGLESGTGTDDLKVEIVMPPAASKLFIAELFGSTNGRGINTVWHALSKVSVELSPN